MQLPREGSSAQVRVRFARYVLRRLRQAGLSSLATDVERANAALKLASRAAEDAQEPVQDALADRDAADQRLDGHAQDARASLAGRSRDAAREEPYTLIFPDGISYFIAAPQDEQQERYRKLVARVKKHLPTKDAVRAALPKQIEDGLEAFSSAIEALQKAESAADDADAALKRATAAWIRQLERTYGALIAEVGRSEAEAFFPRNRAKAGKAAVEPTT